MLHVSALCHLIFITTLNVPNVYKCKWVFFKPCFQIGKYLTLNFICLLHLYFALFIHIYILPQMNHEMDNDIPVSRQNSFPQTWQLFHRQKSCNFCLKKKQRPFTNFTTICNRNIGDVTKSTTCSLGLILIQDKHFSISFQDVTT